ncbi:4-hydroxybenzoate octaprenyltransferase [Moraxella ovis]|uniref:4-hydroxybenzoate octaprenyltransferase n=1 Tax=Moraxella ovis TaxID=29433 RepID=UPI000D9EA5E7|nr:4-hydroxybenzoate octaprenyltransferase [Moraxella ovis]SPX84424.1 4-hydroxybenzoate octaprenyltransferase [Moraxella ovis]STZ06990.1 4-hydroxybenzoate octaprenyltransferase [Moraxella ovis]
MTFKDKLIAWLQLTRFDKPVGTELLLYPTLWALFLANAGLQRLPSIAHLVIFMLGAIFMRAAGCAINDFADRKVDGQVKRTKDRPLADGRLSAKTALVTFVGLALLSACLLVFLPLQVFYWSFGAVALAFIYPFMKRYTHLPQVVLAAAFGWAVPMAYAATLGHVDGWGWLVFAAYMCWTVAYDTQYAMCDRDDDLKIGVKSTAILFGRYDVTITMLLHLAFALLMGLVLRHYFDNWTGWLLVAPLFVMFAYQYRLIRNRERMACFRAFRHNAWVGRYVFALVLILCIFYFGG